MSFEHLNGFVRDLKATSSTLDKVGIIEDYTSSNDSGANFIKKILLYEFYYYYFF